MAGGLGLRRNLDILSMAAAWWRLKLLGGVDEQLRAPARTEPQTVKRRIVAKAEEKVRPESRREANRREQKEAEMQEQKRKKRITRMRRRKRIEQGGEEDMQHDARDAEGKAQGMEEDEEEEGGETDSSSGRQRVQSRRCQQRCCASNKTNQSSSLAAATWGLKWKAEYGSPD